MPRRCMVLVPRATRFFRDIPELREKNIERLEFSKDFAAEYKTAIKYLFERCKVGFKNKPSTSSGDANVSVLSIGCSISDEIENDLENKFEPRSALRNKIEDTYKGFVMMFEDWIKFIDGYIFNVNVAQPSKAIEFVNCIELNDCGVIDYAATARRLLTHPKIGGLDRLKIACVHCLEESVRNITRSLEFPSSFAKGCNEKTAKIMEFWMKYLKNDKYRGKVDDLIHDVDYDNETAVKFFWDKLNAAQKCYNLMYVFSNSSVYRQCAWLMEMTAEQQLNVLSKSGGHMLMKMRNSFIWSDYFFVVAFFAREVIPDEQYYDLIRDVGNDMMDDVWKGHDKNRTILHKLWEYAPQHARDHFYQQKDVEFMFHYLRKIYDFDFLREVVAGGSEEFKKRFFQSDDGVRVISYLTCNDYFDEFNKLYKAAFPRVDEAVEYKMKFVCSEPGYVTTFENSMCQKNKKDFDKMLKNVFLTDKAANKFKKQFLFNAPDLYVFHVLTRRVFYTSSYQGKLRKSIELEELLVVVRWFLGTKKELDLFINTKLCHMKKVKKVIMEVLGEAAYPLLDVFLNWAFKHDPLLVVTYKKNLFGEESKDEWHEMIYELIKKDNTFEALNQLAIWIDADENEQKKFKQIVLKHFPKMRHLLKYLLYEERFETANAFLSWCGVNSDKQAIAYMKELYDGINWRKMVSEHFSRSGSVSVEDGQMNEEKTAKCMKIIDWMGLAVSKKARAEFLKKCQTNGFVDSDLEYDENEDL